MSKVQIGPLSELHFSDLKEILEPVQGPLERHEDVELLREFQRRTTPIGPVYYPQFSGLPEFIYTEVEKDHLLLVKGYLDKIGMPLVLTSPLEEQEDYLCPRCKYSARAPGLCPKHQVPLLDFSSWVATKNVRIDIGFRYFYIAVLLAVGAAVIWSLIFGGADILRNL